MMINTDFVPEYYRPVKLHSNYTIVSIISLVAIGYFALIIFPIVKSCYEGIKDFVIDKK